MAVPPGLDPAILLHVPPALAKLESIMVKSESRRFALNPRR